MGLTHWIYFYIKSNADSMSLNGSAKKSFFFGSFVGSPDKCLLNQFCVPKSHHKYKIQNKNSGKCGTYWSYHFYLFERGDYSDAILKMYFG